MTARPWRILSIFLLTFALACGGGDGGDPTDPFTPGDDGSDPGTGPGTPTDTTASPTEKPDTLPHFGAIGLYGADSPLNQAIPSGAEVDPGSSAMIQKLQSAGSFYISVKRFSSPVYFADASTPKVDVSLPCGVSWELGVSTLKDVPMPEWAEAANDDDTGADPSGCGEESEKDNHMVVLDLSSRCEYDFWQARKSGGAWEASWGNAISLDGDGIYDAGLSTRGSGFAFPGGVLWPDELRSGEITHALAFNSPFTRSGGPVAPATDSDGITVGEDAIPEGALLRLDPDFDTSGLSGAELAIARALQTYGMYLVDTGGDADSGVSLYAVDPRSVANNPYEGVLPDTDWVDLPNIPLDRFQVMKMGAQDGDFEEKLGLVASGCGELS